MNLTYSSSTKCNGPNTSSMPALHNPHSLTSIHFCRGPTPPSSRRFDIIYPRQLASPISAKQNYINLECNNILLLPLPLAYLLLSLPPFHLHNSVRFYLHSLLNSLAQSFCSNNFQYKSYTSRSHSGRCRHRLTAAHHRLAGDSFVIC